ncbi:MAG TPA: hypothetical protein VGD48_12750 [Kutzneria sp.]
MLGPNTLYTAPNGAFTDVTKGSNQPGLFSDVCTAANDADGPTGAGVPNGLAGF